MLNRSPKPQAVDASDRASDEVLMVRVGEGDVAAYEELYHRHKNRLLTFLFRYVGDRDLAEDLVQETFLKVYRAPRSFDPRNRFPTWLFTVGRNLAIDQLRKKKPVASLVQDSEGGEFSHEPEERGVESPPDLALFHEMEGRLMEVLMGMSDKLREVFVLCAMQGLSYEEVAQIVGCPAKTVSSRLARSRKKFMEELAPYLEGRRKE